MELLKNNPDSSPLAFRLRPSSLEDFEGQEHILGKGKLLRNIIESDKIPCLIFYGPPGCGKSTISQIIANRTKAYYEQINAVTSNVAELRSINKKAKERLAHNGQRTILLIDEIHRFSKTQQDALLPDCEQGIITFIGITTENPFFYVTAQLRSRSNIFEFKQLPESALEKILFRAVEENNKDGEKKIIIDPDAARFLVQQSLGDARRLLNTLEVAILLNTKVSLEVAEEAIQRKAIAYDRDGDEHYNTISAFIKSMRGSDPDAAVYWLAKMLSAGEDPRFIARRIIICASEDVGNADPLALCVASSALNGVELVGMPEAQIILSQAAIYIATAPKSNASYLAIESAMSDINKGEIMEVPPYLKDANYKGAQKLGHGIGYKYPHDFPKHVVEQKYIPKDKKYYEPSDMGYEAKIKARMEKIKEFLDKNK